MSSLISSSLNFCHTLIISYRYSTNLPFVTSSIDPPFSHIMSRPLKHISQFPSNTLFCTTIISRFLHSTNILVVSNLFYYATWFCSQGPVAPSGNGQSNSAVWTWSVLSIILCLVSIIISKDYMLMCAVIIELRYLFHIQCLNCN